MQSISTKLKVSLLDYASHRFDLTIEKYFSDINYEPIIKKSKILDAKA
jgi:hypothetical protein